MRRTSFNSESGAILLIVIIFMLALTIVGLAFLSAGVMENKLARREVYKNQAFYLADGGIEHLTFKLYNWEKPDEIPWAFLGDGRYMVVASYDAVPKPYAISTGQRLKGTDILAERKIKVTLTEEPLFDYTVFADEKILMTGDSTIGTPDGEDKIGTNETADASIELRSVQPIVYGAAYVGPTSPEQVEKAIVAGEGQITGERDSRPKRSMVPMELPGWAENISPTDLSVKNTVLISAVAIPDSDGNYIGNFSSIEIKATHDNLIIDKDSVLVVDTLKIVGGQITIEEGINFTLYLTGSADIKGNGIVNESTPPDPTLVHIYGTSTCTDISYAGTETFYGAVYAPEAAITCGGDAGVVGSIIGNTVYLKGTPEVIWHSSLGSEDEPSIIYPTNWQQIF